MREVLTSAAGCVADCLDGVAVERVPDTLVFVGVVVRLTPVVEVVRVVAGVAVVCLLVEVAAVLRVEPEVVEGVVPDVLRTPLVEVLVVVGVVLLFTEVEVLREEAVTELLFD